MEKTLDFLCNNWLETTGAILSVVYLVLSIKQNIWLWFFGFLSSALYIVVFFHSKFYADMTLQFYYLVVSVYGAWKWRFGTQEQQQELPVRTVTRLQIIQFAALSLALWIVYYAVLNYLTDSDVAAADALTTALSIVATWMLAQKIKEHWLVWIFVDAFSSYLYFCKELYPTAVLFIIYTSMAIVGYIQWKRSQTQHNT